MFHVYAEGKLRKYFTLISDIGENAGRSKSIITFGRKLKAQSSLRNISKGASITHA